MAFITPLILPTLKRTPQKLTSRRPPHATITPLADRVLVKVDTQSDQTVGGLYLSQPESAKATTGRVISVGTGRYSADGALMPNQVSVGDHVMWKDEFGAEKVVDDIEGELLALKIYSIVAKW